ncbi:MAG: glycosyltransferase family 2 protein [Chloroflexota bacterium]
MWNGSTISVILPTYNEKDSIRACIESFEELGIVDEILVINNNAAAGTSEEVAPTSAREIIETRQGYGWAIRRGLKESRGEYIILAEPDGTFLARDTLKLLAYSDDFDVVYGSRTARMFIWHGANMGLFLRWGNWAVAKMMELLFDTTNLTDVGCTMRLLRRDAYLQMEPFFTIGGSHFGPEMMLVSVLQGHRVVQIPVNYLPRVGESSVTGSTSKAFVLGMEMIRLVWQYRIKSWLGATSLPRTVRAISRD